ncbi:MAG: ATP-binding protein [Clostridia bacterium]
MGKALKYLKRSITRRLVVMMLAFLALVLVGAIVVRWMNMTALQENQTIEAELRYKQELVSDIAYHTNQLFFRVRGYYAFKHQSEYDAIFTEKQELYKTLDEFGKLQLNRSEKELLRQVRDFFHGYFERMLPQAIKLVKQNDYEGLRQFSAGGVNQAVNDLMAYADRVKRESEQDLIQQNQRLFEKFRAQGVLFLVYFLGIMLVAVLVTLRTSKAVGTPLRELAKRTGQFARGEQVQLEGLSRPDEIGDLSRSFQYMMVQIQAKEEELLAQNEELTAQQDELQMQQEELQEALAKTEENERYLEKRNRLILSLANTLNKQELLHSIIRNMVDVANAEKGMVVLLNPTKDHAAFGVSEEGVAQFLQQMDQGILLRIKETKQPYEVARQQTSGEKGYHLEQGFSYDLFLPVLSANDEMIACIVLTRIGNAVTKQQMKEAAGLAKQISLALEKLEMYEETEMQRQLTQDMLDTIQEGVQLLNPDGSTIQVNRQMREMLGFEQEQAQLYLPLDQLCRFLAGKVQDHEQLIHHIREAVEGNEGKGSTVMYEIIAPVRRYVQMYNVPLYRGAQKLGTLLVHRDITLEYQVDRMKSEFVSTVSHELRTPLASILGFTELLLNKELSYERQRKYMQTINQEASRLTELINDFLDLQRMESGKQSYAAILLDPVPLIQECVDLQKVNTTLHTFRLQSDTNGAHVSFDPDKLRQVLMNLISNAVKYSPRGGKIDITSYVEANDLIIDITDEGLGIPEEAMPHLFTKFYRVDNSDRREIGGTGLGLAIVKEILHTHGASITVRSQLGAGSSFSLKLPVTANQQQALARSEAAAAVGPGMTAQRGNVMIIEDDRSLAELLTEELQGNGFQVFRFENGTDALSQMKAILPDAVVLDLILGQEVDGWEVIAAMKNDAAMSKIPILISSAFEEKSRALELGIKGYLVKPYHPHMLTNVLRKLLEERA